jgi:ABC-type polysaccharide/polyol phosphate export permease
LVPKNLREYFYLNPLVPMINMWRDMFYYGTIQYKDLFVLMIELCVILGLSFYIYKKYSPYFAERS